MEKDKLISKFCKLLQECSRIRFSLPLFPIEIDLRSFLDTSEPVDAIVKLEQIKSDLQAAIIHVDTLRNEAESRKIEVEKLDILLKDLEKDKQTAEKMLQFPEQSLTRLLIKAGSKGRIRGIIEGIIIGVLTGVGSGFLVWWFTR